MTSETKTGIGMLLGLFIIVTAIIFTTSHLIIQENNITMNAQEAHKLTQKHSKQYDLGHIFQQIKQAASKGQPSVTILMSLPEQVHKKLESLGYAVREDVTEFGVQTYIYWGE